MDRGIVALIGVPFNSAGRHDGVARAPAALRQAGLMDALRGASPSVRDAGDVHVEAAQPIRDPVSRIIAPDALAAMIRNTRETVGSVLADGAFPVVVGGDCPILIGCLGATDEPPGLLFVDGHEDAWPPAVSTTGEAADMELGFLLGRTLDGLPDVLVREIPRLEPDRVVVVGARDERELAAAGVETVADVVRVVRPETLVAGATDLARAIAQDLAAAGPWWLHVDLDVLATESLAAVDYPQPGGLTWDELTGITRSALAMPGLLGLDITIYNPDLDPGLDGARRIVRYVADAFSGGG